MKKSVIGSFVMAALLALTSCGAKETNEIKIGGIFPLSGAVAVYGVECKNGIDLAIEEINAAGGINGKNVVLISEDDEGNPDKTVNAYQKLTSKDGAKIILKGNQIKNADLNAEMVRISNTNNAKNVSFEIENETYNWIAGDATQWTSYLLYEDDSTAGKAEDYTGININIKNLMCDGEKITELADGNSRKRVQLMYRPDNGGILAMPDSNNPAITIQ